MMRLNLLPWRERQRQATLRRFRSRLVAGAILALCAVMLVDQLARQRGQQQALSNTRQQAALERLAEQLRPLDDVRAQHQALLERLAALESLRAQQGILGDVFTDLEGALPMGVQLLDAKRRDKRKCTCRAFLRTTAQWLRCKRANRSTRTLR